MDTWRHGHEDKRLTWTWRRGTRMLGNFEVLQQKINREMENGSPGKFP